MRVYLPSDRFQTAKLIEALLQDEKPAYLRVGRNAVEDIYTEDDCPFAMDRATVIVDGKAIAGGEDGASAGDGAAAGAADLIDVLLVSCGEMVRPAVDAAALLKEKGLKAVVLDMYCVKPLDSDAIIKVRLEG